jgi:acetate kinase
MLRLRSVQDLHRFFREQDCMLNQTLSAPQTAALLTFNVGSSSIKFSVFEAPSLTLTWAGALDAIGQSTTFQASHLALATEHTHAWAAGQAPGSHKEAVTWLVTWLQQQLTGQTICAVGHRVVHGGLDFDGPVLVNDQVMAKLKTLEPLAPLHQPHNLAGIEAARQAFVGVPQVACFDTAFHAHQPFVKDCFALPRKYYDEGVRRYGFHGLSYEFIAQHLREAFPLQASGRVIVAHLGSGASMCAMLNGHSIASTMGFSALDGLPMGTRCGQLDPGVLLYLMQDPTMTADVLSDMLYKESGLKGISGLSGDMRVLQASDRPEARDAVDYFVYRTKREFGALAAALEGLDVIVLTGGIGEHAAGIRESILAGLAWLGVEVDHAANQSGQTILSTPHSRVLCLRIPTNEELMIAQHTYRTIHSGTGDSIGNETGATPGRQLAT